MSVRRIKVTHNWGGAPSNGARILPGEYDINDPALYGCDQYLLDNGHAVEIAAREITQEVVKQILDEAEPAVVEEVEPEAEPAPKPKKGK